MISLHSQGSCSGSPVHQYKGETCSSAEKPGMPFLKSGRNPTSSTQPHKLKRKKKKRWGREGGEAVAFLYLFAIGSRFLFFPPAISVWIQSLLVGLVGFRPMVQKKLDFLFLECTQSTTSTDRTWRTSFRLSGFYLIHAKRKFIISSGFNLLFLII